MSKNFEKLLVNDALYRFDYYIQIPEDIKYNEDIDKHLYTTFTINLPEPYNDGGAIGKHILGRPYLTPIKKFNIIEKNIGEDKIIKLKYANIEEYDNCNILSKYNNKSIYVSELLKSDNAAYHIVYSTDYKTIYLKWESVFNKISNAIYRTKNQTEMWEKHLDLLYERNLKMNSNY